MKHPDERELREGETLPEATGDCFEAAFRLADRLSWQRPNAKVRLVHAVCLIGTGDHEGLPYSHAWVEVEEVDEAIVALAHETFGEEAAAVLASCTWVVCHDHSNGRKVELPSSLYYLGGRPSQVHRYSMDEVRRKAVEHEHYGPWDLECDR